MSQCIQTTPFSEILSAWQQSPRHTSGRLMITEGFYQRLFGAESRGWFHACHIWVHGGLPPIEAADSARLLDGLDPRIQSLAHLHLECARALKESGQPSSVPEPWICELSQRAGVAPGLVRDLLVELASSDDELLFQSGSLNGALRRAEVSQAVTALLVEHEGEAMEGVVADLRLELVRPGTGRGYPTPALAFLGRDDEFEQSVQVALEYARQAGLWPEGCDLRWRVARRDGHPLCTSMLGGSLGGCFAFGLEQMLAGEGGLLRALCKLALGGVAISATIQATGRLGRVGHILPKLLAAARDKCFPRVHTVIVSADQDEPFLRLQEEPKNSNIFRDPREDFHVLRAATLKEGIEMLVRDEQDRWHGIDCQAPLPDPDFTGREKLFSKVREFVESRQSGYLILHGQMGIGKTAFMGALVNAEQAAGNVPVYHLISSAHTGTPEQIAACFYDRLRRKHRILEPSAWAHFKIEVKLERLLLELSAKLRAENRKEVLYLEAADQTHLAPGQVLLPGLLGRLPPGFFCVITTRFQTNWYRPHDQVKCCSLADVLEDQIDVRDYLLKKNRQLTPPLCEEFIDRIVAQTQRPVFFTVVSCFQRLQETDTPDRLKNELRTNPALWAMPPKQLISQALARRCDQARSRGIAESDFWIALGLLTVAAGEGISQPQLQDLGVWNADREAVLDSCASFFKSQPSLEDTSRPYVFAHPGYPREIQERAGAVHLGECHRLLAKGCARAWQEPQNAARTYALRQWPLHLRERGEYHKLCEVLTDLSFLQEAIGADSVSSGVRPGRLQMAPAMTAFRLARELRSAVEVLPGGHPGRGELKAIGDVVDKHSHLLQEDPSLLFQLLYNDLGWQFSTEQGLGRRIQQAAEAQTRPLLKCLVRPERRQVQEPLRILAGHRGAVLSVAFSPDGSRVASASADGKVRLWHASSGEALFELDGHQGLVNAVAFAPQGCEFASAGADGLILIWDPERGKPLRRIDTGSGHVLALAYTRDGRYLVSGGVDGVLRFWDSNSGALHHRSTGHCAAIRTISISPDNLLVASGSEDCTIRYWRVQDGNWEATIRHEQNWVESLAFLADNRTVVSGGGFRCGQVKFWDPEHRHSLRILGGHREGIKALAVSNDGVKLASASYDGKLLVRNVHTGVFFPPMGHTDKVEAIAFSPDSKTLVSASADRTLRIWALADEPVLATLEDDPLLAGGEPAVQALIFLAEGQKAVCCNKTGEVKLLDVQTGATKATFSAPSEHNVSCVAVSPDGEIAAGGSHQELRLWSIKNNSPARLLYGHAGWVLAACFSPDGKRIAAGGEDDRLILWDSASGNWLHTFHCEQIKVRAVAFSNDGGQIASGGANGTLRLWDTTTHALLRVFSFHTAAISSICFAPTGNLLATGGEDEGIHIVNHVTGFKVSPNRLHRGAITALAFSPCGRWLASGSADCTVRIWDVQTGSLLAWTPCGDRILSLRFKGPHPTLQIADAGGASHRPSFYLMELTNPKSQQAEIVQQTNPGLFGYEI